MRTTYNQLAGQSVERLAALSDGVFAIAMTLLILEVHTPVSEGINSEGELWRAILHIAPQLTAYLMSFLTLGIFWVGQQAQLSNFARTDRHLTWISIGFLMGVSFLPFSTALLAKFISFRIALLIYWMNILLLGIVIFTSWRYAVRAGLLKEHVTEEIRRAVERRVVFAQSMYAVGAALCALSTYVSIGWIVAVQLYFVFAPGYRAVKARN